MMTKTTTLSNETTSLEEKFFDLPGSTISKLKEINYYVLTAEEWE